METCRPFCLNLRIIMQLSLNDYNFNLPQEKIAEYPLENRDASKLMVYRKGAITDRQFNQLPAELPDNAFLVFNNTRVIPARIYFTRKTGAVIEVLLLHPLLPTKVVNNAMMLKEPSTWEAIIGNLKKWKDEEVLEQIVTINSTKVKLSAKLVNREAKQVELSWDNQEFIFSEVIEAVGKIPLPPYILRELREEDKEQYQTIYAANKGAVAAPTAGLHFTDAVMTALNAKGIKKEFITLHVGAGTFQPVKEENAVNHKMHNEQIVFTKQNIENLLKNRDMIIPVGTTSLRALESLYWYGVLLHKGQSEFFIEKLAPYDVNNPSLSSEESLQNILDYMTENKLEQLIGETEIFIFPGYSFRLCKGLITNYHLPKSTLIMLVAAFVGDDWKKIYQHALENNYRFLSYGDSSLLLP